MLDQICLFLIFQLVSLQQASPIAMKTAVTKTFYLQQPDTLARVFRQTLSTSSSGISCQQIKNQAYVAINYQFRLTGYRNFDEQLNQWQTQIVSADHDQASGRVWALLSNGDLLLLESAQQYTHQLQQIKRYQKPRNTGWVDGSLLVTKQFIFLRVSSGIKLIRLKVDFWQEEAVGLDQPVIEAIIEKEQLFVMTSKQIWIMGANKQKRSYQDKRGELSFKDMDVQGKYIYALTNRLLLVVDKGTLSLVNSIEIEEGQWASQLAVKGKYAVVHFKKHKQSVLREFVMDEGGIGLQAGVLHHQFQKIKDIFILDDNAVVLSGFEFTLFQLNTNYERIPGAHVSPLPFKYQNIVTFKQIISKKMVLLLAGPNFIQIAEVKSKVSDFNVYGGILACTISQPGLSQLRVKYQGLCYQDHSRICERQIFYVIDAEQDAQTRLFGRFQIMVIVLVVLLVLIGCILYKTRQRDIKEQIRSKMIEQNRPKGEISQYQLKSIPQSVGKNEAS